VSPQWLLEWWLGTVPLRLLVPIWDHMLRNAGAVPSMMNLQISLVMLQLLHPQLKNICAMNADDTQLAFTLLQSVHLPERHPDWLLERSLQIPLNEGAVQELRERVRVAVLACALEETLVPSVLPLSEVRRTIEFKVFSQPLPLLRPPSRHPPCTCCACPRLVSMLNALAAAAVTLGFVTSLILWLLYGSRSQVQSVTVQVDLLVCLLALSIASFATCRWQWPRPAVAFSTAISIPYATVQVPACLICVLGCCLFKSDWPAGGHWCDHVPEHRAKSNQCDFVWWWPMALCCLLAAAALLQTIAACNSLRRDPMQHECVIFAQCAAREIKFVITSYVRSE
ncbi:MAG: hypothetical protein SGPRY_008120, partial [Prymnesium sp.]